jgi:hypothetical protein
MCEPIWTKRVYKLLQCIEATYTKQQQTTLRLRASCFGMRPGPSCVLSRLNNLRFQTTAASLFILARVNNQDYIIYKLKQTDT